MSAPSLVLIAHGSADPGVAQITHCMRKQLTEMRPGLDVHVAFLDQCPPSGPQVISHLARKGVEEVVLVPLDVSRAFGTDEAVDTILHRVRATHPGLRIIAAQPIGPQANLLNLVDRQLRAALRASGTGELDGLVLSAAGCDDPRGAALLARRARQWGVHHKLPCVVAHDLAPAAGMARAIRSLRAQGRRHIAVGSWYLAPDDSFAAQRAEARAQGAVAVSDPFGDQAELLDLALARYAFAAMDLIAFDDDQRDAGAAEQRHLSIVG